MWWINAAVLLWIGMTPLAFALAQGSTVLFRDDFQVDVDSAWAMEGENFGMVNNQLSSLGAFTAHVGSMNWSDYAVEFDIEDISYPSHLRVLIRRQDDINYMSWHIYKRLSNTCEAAWIMMRDGVEQEIVNTEADIRTRGKSCEGHYRIEAIGNTYRAFKDGELVTVFTNNVFSSGNAGLIAIGDRTRFAIDNFEVLSIRRSA